MDTAVLLILFVGTVLCQDITNDPVETRATLYPQLFPNPENFPSDTGTLNLFGTVNTEIPDPFNTDAGTGSDLSSNTIDSISSDLTTMLTSSLDLSISDAPRTAPTASGSSVSSASVSDSSNTRDRISPESMTTGDFIELTNTLHTVANNNQGQHHQFTIQSDKQSGHTEQNRGNPFSADVLPPEKFFKWLSSDEPVENYIEIKQQSVTVPNDSTSDKSFFIIIITICGTVSLCVIGIIVAICYRNRMYSDKEASLSHHETPVRFHPSSKIQEEFIAPVEYPNIFMGIPANNDIWKDLQNLPETTSVIIPDTKNS